MIALNAPHRQFQNNQPLISRLNDLFLSGPYLNGNETLSFEADFSDFIGVQFSLLVSSGTSALELALKSVKRKDGHYVLMAANAGGYAAIAATNVGLIPKFIDVDDFGLLISEKIGQAISDKVDAIVVTHLYGQTTDVESIRTGLAGAKTPIIEDCAQSCGSIFEGKRSGSFGDISCFSFYPTKNLSTIGDAGAVCTSNRIVYEKILSLRQYGWEGERYFAKSPNGSNYRADEIHALVLRDGLTKLDARNAKRKEIWRRYNSILRVGNEKLIGSESDDFVAHLAVLVTDYRNEFRSFMEMRGIETAIHYPYPDYKQSAIQQTEKTLLKTEYLCKSVVSIPLYPELEENEIVSIEHALSQWVNRENV